MAVSTAIFNQVYDVMNAAGMCGRSVQYIMSQAVSFRLLLGKERTNTFNCAPKSSHWKQTSSSVASVLIEQPYEVFVMFVQRSERTLVREQRFYKNYLLLLRSLENVVVHF